MITRIKLEESIEAFGGIGGGIMTKDVVAALLKLGINCGFFAVSYSKSKSNSILNPRFFSNLFFK